MTELKSEENMSAILSMRERGREREGGGDWSQHL
jgi:hypothetical protein